MTGTVYFVHVSGSNGVGGTGFGPTASSVPTSEAPLEAPAAVEALQAVAPTAKSIPIQTVEVSWQPPADTGGASVTHYLLEHWCPDEVVEEVQRVRVYNVLDGETSGSFGVGFRGDTALVPHNADAVTMRHSLMSMPSVGDVGVTRQAYNYGYQWDVTFRDHASNLGDQPRMVITSLPAAGNGTVYADVTQPVNGSRAGGRDEVQAVVTSSSGTGLNGVSGYFRLALSAAGPFTQQLPCDATADVVRTAPLQLPAVGRVAVSRDNTTSLGADGGATWRITFTSGTQPVGVTGHAWDAPVLVADGARLEGTGAAIAVESADNDVGTNGALTFPNSVKGEVPARYTAVELPASQPSEQLTGLATGAPYAARVTAKNALGRGVATTVGRVTPPVQLPGAPRDVVAGPLPGSHTSLQVNYTAPASDGGAQISRYRIAWTRPAPSPARRRRWR